jgi:hypothetical protein
MDVCHIVYNIEKCYPSSMMKPTTTHQMITDVLTHTSCQRPIENVNLFRRAGCQMYDHDRGIFKWFQLWLAVQEAHGNQLASSALDALLEM